jgi:toxin-antitoxin system PIN domain toxin
VSATLDADLLLNATDSSSRYHGSARTLMHTLAAGPEELYLFWPVAVAYARIATDEGLFEQPLTADQVKANLESLIERPHVKAVGEEQSFWEAYGESAHNVFLKGDFVAHGYLVSLMRQHRVTTLWSHDPEFRQFPGIIVRNPYRLALERTPAADR